MVRWVVTTDMLSQVRSGGIQMYTGLLRFPPSKPVAAINAIGFAFADYNQVWAAMDGKPGGNVRAAFACCRLACVGNGLG